MRKINIDRGWGFSHGRPYAMNILTGTPFEKTVDLPHDYMIESDVRKDATAGAPGGYYKESLAYYNKMLDIPKEWEDDKVFLCFDGVMMNATVELNGGKVALQHCGYIPFCVDITPYVYFGQENRLTVLINPNMQPNSRWYAGSGIFRSAFLVHTPRVHLKEDGIFVYTDHIEYKEDGTPDYAVLKAEIELCNETHENRLVDVEVVLAEEKSGTEVLARTTRLQVNAGAEGTAYMEMILDEPLLWSADEPNLYTVTVRAKNIGVFKTHLHHSQSEDVTVDENSVLFGVRTITSDARHGLRINGKTVKLKGGCIHHDNGVIGAVSLYDAEARKLSLLKESGFNAVRTTHNPPSAALIEAADRLGMYVFDEAFDAWGIAKKPGDYNLFFETDWEKDLRAFVRRDRVHPCVIIWSTGNEITERGGLNDGYVLATRLARAIKALDPSRPVSNGFCSYWCGLDDLLTLKEAKALSAANIQNADIEGTGDTDCSTLSQPYFNGLDIVGYNYMEWAYSNDHERFPDRLLLGSENFGNQIGIHWPMIEKTPYVIGDFTWTAFDYIGEAGLGQGIFVDKDDPKAKDGAPHVAPFPWRLANDADFDITGALMPQGAYRRVVWGSDATHLYSYDPAVYDKAERITRWGFIGVEKRWDYSDKEGQNTRVVVFSAAEEVELIVNGVSQGIKKAGEALAGTMPALPRSFLFETVYQKGEVIAISRNGGVEVSRDVLTTTGAPSRIALIPETTEISADGHALAYVRVELQDDAGRVVPYADNPLRASVSGSAALQGFGTGNPITDQNYAKGAFDAYKGRAIAVLRAGYDAGEACLTVEAEGIGSASIVITVG